MPDAGFTHFARANDHDGLCGKVFVEDTLSEFDCNAADGRCAAADGGLGADFFRDLEGALEEAIGDAAGEFGVLSGLVGLFDLASDFGFAEDHRVETAGNGEEMFGGCSAFFDVKVGGEIDVAGGKDPEETMNGAVYPWSDTVNFDSVAGGQEDDFGEVADEFEAAAEAAEPGSVYGEFFPQFDRRGLVAQTCDEKVHNSG